MRFDIQQAIRCAKAIQAVYADPSLANVVDAATDTQVRVERQDERNWNVIIPGTDSLRDWLTDLKVRKVKTAHGGIHRGFLAAARAAHHLVRAQIPSESVITLTGHSLGGALATLIAVWLHQSYEVAAVYTFGSPRVGNGAFARGYNARLGERTWRVVNAHDLVPHSPPPLRTFTSGVYTHVDTQVYLRSDNTVQIDQPLRVAVSEAQDTFQAITTPVSAFSGIAVPHHIHSYLRKLEALQQHA